MASTAAITHTQDHELSHSMVHYLLTIHKLKEDKGYARVTDIAKDLQITKGSVSTALNTLKKRDLVTEEEDSKFLELSDEGHRHVHRILSSRTLLYYFLKDFLKVSDQIAHKDSCLMEHLVSNETREKFFHFMKQVACDCEQGRSVAAELNVEASFDLCRFSNPEEFMEEQKGDSHLRPGA